MKLKHPKLPVEVTVSDAQAAGWVAAGWIPAPTTSTNHQIVGEQGPELFVPTDPNPPDDES